MTTAFRKTIPKVVKAGSAVGYVECDVKDQTGKLVARVSSSKKRR